MLLPMTPLFFRIRTMLRSVDGEAEVAPSIGRIWIHARSLILLSMHSLKQDS
jgi:hypothetical protein